MILVLIAAFMLCALLFAETSVLILVLVASFVVSSLFLAELGVMPWLAILIAIPVAYAVAYALSRVMRGAGTI